MAMSRIPGISERVKAVDLLVSSHREAAGDIAAGTQNMQDIEREMAMSMAETQGGDISVTAADAQTLMQLSGKYGEKYTFQVVLPLVKKHASNVDFTVAFLTELFQAGEADKLRLEVVRSLFKDILGDVIPDLQLYHWEVGREQPRDDFAKRRRFDHDRYRSQITEDHGPRIMTGENIATLFHHCDRLGLWHEIDQLANTMISHAPSASVATFEHVLLPLLKQLPPPVEREPKIESPHSYNLLFRAVLSSYIITYVQPAPPKPTGLERPPRSCGFYCDECVKLDTFLKNPDQAQARFRVKAKRRDHLEDRLRQSYCSTEIITSGTPYTLVVKKMGMEWENQMKEWKQRCGVALKAIEEIGFEKLRGLLGEGWEDVVGLGRIRENAGGERRERHPLGDLAQGRGLLVRWRRAWTRRWRDESGLRLLIRLASKIW
ncbi:MAG: hypothetical protein ALECFALPRED_010708 [Alectoria fallacina]|uniref:Uncharacterized protein n=1 Tax=Alectoria fallacina TaxID=1903189 RepID=A0A8H3J998_9LECA|nr:MAG: hypothetical protein ALECFALPRED_010708 [Alectoria fallacina]